MNWLAHHVDRFPKLKGYFANQQGENRIEEDWRKAFEKYEAKDLYAATERMTRIDKTIWEAQHKPKLLNFAFQARRDRRLIEAAPADSFRDRVKCLDCKDDGVIRILFPTETGFSDCVAACLCESGQVFSRKKENGRQHLRPFRQTDYVYDYSLDNWQQQMDAARLHYKSIKKPKPFPEFETPF